MVFLEEQELGLHRFAPLGAETLDERRDGGELLGAQVDELLGLDLVAASPLRGLELAEDAGDLLGGGPSGLLRQAEVAEIAEDPVAQLLGAGADAAGQGPLKEIRGAPGPLEALRRDAEPFDAPQDRRLGPPEVVAVEVRRRVGGQQVQLQEIAHQAPLPAWGAMGMLA